ncbi:MAG: hypothetical protein ACFE0O_01045 [Opitutales bacterium]
MKSAYELAMERLRSEEPDQPLTDEQKAQLAELDRTFEARRAEKEVFLQGKIAEARAAGDRDQIEALQKQLRDERAILREDLEAAKAKVRAKG